jgi:hypothetical protein
MDFDCLLPIRAQIGKKNPYFFGHETLVLCVEIRFFGENLPKKKSSLVHSEKKPYHEIEQPTISNLVVKGP